MITIPTSLKQTNWLFAKRGGVEFGTTENKSSCYWQEGGFELGTSGLQIQQPKLGYVRLHKLQIYITHDHNLKFNWHLKCYLDLSIRESVPDPMRAVHTVGQTVARHPVVTVIPPLSYDLAHCGFQPEFNLQPLVAIVFVCTPSPDPTLTGDCIEAGELGNEIGVV